jgi:hypothetical protein
MNDSMMPTVHAMLRGMAVLVIPAFFIVCGITLMVVRRWKGSPEE